MFLGKVREALTEGKNLVLLFPERFQPRFEKKLYYFFWEDLRREGTRIVHALPLPKEPYPEKEIWAGFFIPSPRWKVLGPQDVASSEALAGKWGIVMDLDQGNSCHWGRFIQEYQHLVSSQPVEKRFLLILISRGKGLNEHVQEDVCLSIFKWEDVWNRVDCSFFVYQVLGRRGGRLEDRLKQSLIETLDLWDPELIYTLSSKELPEFLHPNALLHEYAVKRSWGNDMSPSWEKGTIQRFGEGRRFTPLF